VAAEGENLARARYKRKEHLDMDGMRRRATTTVLAGATVLALTAGVAAAEVFEGNDKPDEIEGTKRADTIRGKGGADELNGRGGADKMFGGSGKDLIKGGAGNDVVDAEDGEADLIDCGAGDNDTVIFDLGIDRAAPGIDPVNGNCENFRPDGEEPPPESEVQEAPTTFGGGKNQPNR
jgi:Ca2+-binding RTX toxin-like protein